MTTHNYCEVNPDHRDVFAECPICEIERLQKELGQWKANHEDMWRRNAYLHQRPDLDVTRIQIYEQMKEENKKLGEQVARLQHSTGTCEMIRKEQKIERLVELISKAIPLYWVVADDMDLAAEWEIEANKLLAEVAR